MHSRSRSLLLGIVGAIALIVVIASGGVVATRDLFSASAFVRVYLDALARGDVTGALSVPGAAPEAGEPPLLSAAAAAPIRIVAVRDDGPDAAGIHPVTIVWREGGREHRSVVQVESAGTRGLVFSRWSFAIPPVAALTLAASGDERVEVNGVRFTVPEPARFLVPVPSLVTVGLVSRYVTAEESSVPVTAVGSELAASVDAQPTDELRELADEAVRSYLDACAAQPVLYPSDCPFGREVVHRVIEGPAWTISEYPELTFTNRGTGWRVDGEGVALLRVRVQRIPDGSRVWVDDEIPFLLRLDAGVDADGSIRLVPNPGLSLL